MWRTCQRMTRPAPLDLNDWLDSRGIVNGEQPYPIGFSTINSGM